MEILLNTLLNIKVTAADILRMQLFNFIFSDN